jgi:hypothetical protein
LAREGWSAAGVQGRAGEQGSTGAVLSRSVGRVASVRAQRERERSVGEKIGSRFVGQQMYVMFAGATFQPLNNIFLSQYFSISINISQISAQANMVVGSGRKN